MDDLKNRFRQVLVLCFIATVAPIQAEGEPDQSQVESISDDELKRRIGDAASVVVVESIVCNQKPRIRTVESIKGSSYYRGQEHFYKTIEPALIERADSKVGRRWILFLPWDPIMAPAIPASADLVKRARENVPYPREWSAVSDDWKIALRPRQEVFKANAPISIEFAATNHSMVAKQRPNIGFSAHAFYPLARLELTTPDGETHNLKSTVQLTRYDFTRTRTAEPGCTLVDTIELDTWFAGWRSVKDHLVQPGEYKLRCLLPTNREEILKSQRAVYGID